MLLILHPFGKYAEYGGEVADEIDSPMATRDHRIFDGSYCEKISYEIKVKQSEIKINSFLAAVGREGEAQPNRGAFACAPQNQESDYHLHVAWRLRKEDFYLEIEFIKGAIAPAPKETEPFAEEFNRWIENFFLTKIVRANVGVDFVYPSEFRQSKFPLPLRVGKPETELAIDGISLRMPLGMHGVEKVWLTQGDEKLWVHVRAERLVELTNVVIRKDIDIIASVVDIVLEEKRPEQKTASEIENQP